MVKHRLNELLTSMPKEKRILIIAGPNGAGKTTFALQYLPREADCPDFINVDLIAAGLSPFDLTSTPPWLIGGSGTIIRASRQG
jgi:hypothetical protein